jgi:GH35 family endo-1,4-beta-xylanase
VAKSFKWAHEANPQGTFILNEFSLISEQETRQKFYRFVKMLKEDSVPVGGLGIQAHEPREMWYSPVEFYKTLDLLSAFNLPIHITEFIPQSSGKDITGGWRTGKWTEEAQADYAEQFYTLAFGYPAVASINWWGFSDKNIWLEGGGLLDKNYDPKPVYNRLKKLIKDTWMTKGLDLKTDNTGAVHFRGFYGQYELMVTKPDGTQKKLEFHLAKDGKTSRELEI